jgi:uncharacterized membrane protein YhaH (DUF805 family)
MHSIISEIASFKGRLDRLQYFLRTLIIILANGVMSGLGSALGGPLAGLVLSLPFCLWAASMTTRRLHDIGLSGWWQLLAPVPWVIGGMIVLHSEDGVEDAVGIIVALIPPIVVYLVPGMDRRNRFDNQEEPTGPLGRTSVTQ